MKPHAHTWRLVHLIERSREGQLPSVRMRLLATVFTRTRGVTPSGEKNFSHTSPFHDFFFPYSLCCATMVPGRRSGGGLCWRATRQGITGRRLIETMVRGTGSLRFPFGSIDIRMPEKTQLRSTSRRRGLLELLRRLIAQRRVQPHLAGSGIRIGERLIAPVIQQPPMHAQLVGQGADVVAVFHALDGSFAKSLCIASVSLRSSISHSQLSFRCKVCEIRVSQFWGSVQDSRGQGLRAILACGHPCENRRSSRTLTRGGWPTSSPITVRLNAEVSTQPGEEGERETPPTWI